MNIKRDCPLIYDIISSLCSLRHMSLSTSYRQIWAISAPIMLASASQNIIVLCDNVFLYHTNNTDFGAIALVGVFYLIVASIGYGFSRGGQILIARRFGEKRFNALGTTFHSLILFQALLALILFAFMRWGAEPFFDYFISSDEYRDRALIYLMPRSWGIFFSYIGLSMIALYTGIARTKFIVIDTIIMTLANIVLNYILIFGKFGFEPMGIEGAGWASTISEIIAFIVFLAYMVWDKKNRKLKVFTKPVFNFEIIKSMYFVSFPIVLQSAVGLGSWFIFFSFVETYKGGKDLEVSNLIRNIYLILSIPCWGFSAGINTLVSNFIGERKRQAVRPLIFKTMKMCLFTTVAISLPVIIFPETILYPIFGKNDMSLILDASPVYPILLGILIIFCIGAIYMNGLMGTGETRLVFRIQMGATIIYVIYIYIVLAILNLNLQWAWGTEILYWLIIHLAVLYYLRQNTWRYKRI